MESSSPKLVKKEEKSLARDKETPKAADKSAAASPPAASSAATKTLCVFCQKRNASKDCPATACTNCCPTTPDKCPKHAAVRAKQAWRQQVLDGRTTEQQLAAEKRRSLLPKHRFRESGFVYTGDTVVIWNLRQYHANSKWRDDARRRAKRRNQIAQDALQLVVDGSSGVVQLPPRRLYCSRKRFRAWVEAQHDKKTT